MPTRNMKKKSVKVKNKIIKQRSTKQHTFTRQEVSSLLVAMDSLYARRRARLLGNSVSLLLLGLAAFIAWRSFAP